MYPQLGRTKPRRLCCAHLVALRRPGHLNLQLVPARQASRSNPNPYSGHRFEGPCCAKAKSRYPTPELSTERFLPGQQTHTGETASDLQIVAFQFSRADHRKRAPSFVKETPVSRLRLPGGPEPNSVRSPVRTTRSRQKAVGVARQGGAA